MSEATSKRRGRWLPWVLGAVAAVYIVFLTVRSIASADDSEAVGYVLGYVAGAVVMALLIRFVYVRTRAAERRPSFWSPWVVVTAAIILLVTRISNAF